MNILADLSAEFMKSYDEVIILWDKHIFRGCFESGVVQSIGMCSQDTKPCPCKRYV